MLHQLIPEFAWLSAEELEPAVFASPSVPEGPLELFKTTIETIVATLAPQAGLRKLALPFNWPFDKKEIAEHLLAIEVFKLQFPLVLQNDLSALTKLTNRISQIGKQVQDLDIACRDQESLQKYYKNMGSVDTATKPACGQLVSFYIYICLCGFPPFSDELYSNEFPYTMSRQIKDRRFDYPSPYWDPFGDPALDLIDSMLVVDPERRFRPEQFLKHPWMLMPSENDQE